MACWRNRLRCRLTGASPRAVVSTAAITKTRYTVCWKGVRVANLCWNAMVSRKPVRTWVPVWVTRSSCRISFQFRSSRWLSVSLRPSVGSTSAFGSGCGAGTSVQVHREPVDQVLQCSVELVAEHVDRELWAQLRDQRVVGQIVALDELDVVRGVGRHGGGSARLQQQVTEQEGGERAVGRHARCVREPVACQSLEERLHPAQAAERGPQPRRRGRARCHQRKPPGMGLGEPAYAGSQRLEIVLPAR